MAQRNADQAQSYKTQTDDYIRSVASETDPSEQIARGKELLDKGAITEQEFARLKEKALAY
jgi:hypothetical protein